MQEYIHVKGAREHNLKNIDIKIPRDKLVVLTGLSGSGKSSLAFDTIYAEASAATSSRCRAMRGSFSAKWKSRTWIISKVCRPPFPSTRRPPRRTRVRRSALSLRSTTICACCGRASARRTARNAAKEIHQQTIDQIIDRLMALEEKTRVQLLAPVIRGKKGEHVKVFENARKQGYVRVRVDGEIHDLSEEFKLAKTKKHNIEIVVDRVVIRPDARGRITDSVETASALSGGLVIADVIGGEPITFSQNYACDDCGISIEELTPRMFSFNNPYGACPVCTGLGIQKRVDPDRVIPNRHLSIKQGAIRAPGWGAPTRAASQRCTTTHSAKSTALRWKRLSRSSPSRRSTSCCTAPEMSRSSCRSAAFRAA